MTCGSRRRPTDLLKHSTNPDDSFTVTTQDEPVAGSGARPSKAVFSQRRAGSWVRRESVEREVDFVVQRWPVLAALILMIAVVVTRVVIITEGAMRGFVLGAGTATACWSVLFIVAQVSGTASTRMGDFGERSTAGELKKLNGGWHVIHHVWFPFEGDVDHVAVGPGGVLAIETKWRSRAWKVTPPDRLVLSAAREADEHADSVRELLARHGVRTKVTPVLVWWSGQTASEASKTPRKIGKTYVVAGRTLSRWIEEHHVHLARLATEQVAAITEVVAEQAAATDAVDEITRPESWWSIVVPLAAMPVAVVFGFLANIDLWVFVHNWVAFAVGTVAHVGLGLWCRRWRFARPAAWGWVLGVLSGAALLAVFALLAD